MIAIIDSMTGVWGDLRADMDRYANGKGDVGTGLRWWTSLMRQMLEQPAAIAVAHYRVGNIGRRLGPLGLPLRAVHLLLLPLVRTYSASDLPSSTQTGPGLSLAHMRHTVAAGAVLGSNVSLGPGVLIGGVHGRGFPTIGDDVAIHSHSVVIGDIHVGDRAVIAAGSVVIRDVPADCLVAGNPAVIKRHGACPIAALEEES